MERKQKLGRGLEEVSQYFLSMKKNEIESEKPIKGNRHIIDIYHLRSDIIQSFFLSNLALELAKNRFPIYIIDYSDNQDINIKAKMRHLVKSQETSLKFTVQLYGLPSIQIYEANPYEHQSIEDLINSINIINNNYYILINTRYSLENIRNKSMLSDVILLTKADKISLLQSYACIKVILEKNRGRTIYFIFDEIKEEEAKAVFQRFAQYIEKKFSNNILYLGCLIHDEYLYRSIKEGEPLVLSQEKSMAKDSVLSVSKNFFRLSKNTFKGEH